MFSLKTQRQPGNLPALVRSPAAMMIVALVFRLCVIWGLHTYRHILPEDPRVGGEMELVAESIASGNGFSSPYPGADTGPTSEAPPAFPYLLGGIFRVFGINTEASVLTILCLDSLFSALTCNAIFYIGKRTFGPVVASWAGWSWAFMPFAIWWAAFHVWETTLSALLLSLVFLFTLRLEASTRFPAWIGYGLLWGLIALTNTALLAFLPLCLIWLWTRRGHGKKFLRRIVFALLACLATVAPWLVRNYLVFGRLVPIRDGLGLELWLGNHEGATGKLAWWNNPGRNLREMEQYRRMGELAYYTEKRNEAIAWISRHPVRFVGISLKRFVFFWSGTNRAGTVLDRNSMPFFAARLVASSLFSVLAFAGLWVAVREKKHGAWLFTSLLFSVPLVYYVTHADTARYRHPIEPAMTLLSVYGLGCLSSRFVRARWERARTRGEDHGPPLRG